MSLSLSRSSQIPNLENGDIANHKDISRFHLDLTKELSVIHIDGERKLLSSLEVQNYDVYSWFTSWAMKPLSLAIYRTFVAAFLFVVAILDFIDLETPHERIYYATKLTYITFFVCILYFAITAMHAFRVLYSSKANLDQFIATSGPWYLYFLQFLYTGGMTFHMMVPIVYWTLVYDPLVTNTTWLLLSSICFHGFPIIFYLIELILNNRFKVAKTECFFLVGFVMIYVFWMWISAGLSWAITKTAVFPYEVFSWDKASNAIFYVATLVLVIGFFFLVYYLHILKRKIFIRFNIIQ